MTRRYTARSGDSLSSIAAANGLDHWRQIYDAPENERFRSLHPIADRIRPGDELFIPDLVALDDDTPDEPVLEDGEDLGSFDGDEDEPEKDDLDDEVDYSADTTFEEDDATGTHPVARNEWNTINTQPDGYFWFSA